MGAVGGSRSQDDGMLASDDGLSPGVAFRGEKGRSGLRPSGSYGPSRGCVMEAGAAVPLPVFLCGATEFIAEYV